MQRGRALACVISCAALLACTGGQSGTKTPKLVDDAGQPDASEWTTLAAPVACACTLADHGALLLHVELIAIDACRVRARVQQTLAAPPEPSIELEPDAELDAARTTGPGCGDAPDLSAGDDALLVYIPPQAGDENADGSALVATWGSMHVFGNMNGAPIALPEAERERVLHTAECDAWFEQHGAKDASVPDMFSEQDAASACSTE